MSSKKSAPPLQINLAPSRQLLVLLLLIHSGALALTAFFECPATLKWIIAISVLVSLLVSLYKAGWIRLMSLGRLSPLRWQFIPVLVWQPDNVWQLSTQDGGCVLAHLLPTSTCHLKFVALNFRTENAHWWDARLSVVIFSDAIDQEVFRQLRARLRTRYVRELNNSVDIK